MASFFKIDGSETWYNADQIVSLTLVGANYLKYELSNGKEGTLSFLSQKARDGAFYGITELRERTSIFPK